MVGAAVSPFDLERAKLLERSGADFLVTDVAHLHNRNALQALTRLVKSVSIDVVAGNIGTREAVLDILSTAENVGGLRVGISSGSICSTGEVAGASVPTLQAVFNARSALEELGLQGKIPIIADGGIRGPGDIVKAVIAGASAAMAGRLFAGTEESLGMKIRVGGKIFKTYRGMASRGAMERRYAADRYSRPSKQLEEGVEGLVPYSGPAAKVVAEVFFGLQAGLGYAGASSVEEAWQRGKLARVTPAGRSEIKPHDIIL
jgi:IMP dehydrogenase